MFSLPEWLSLDKLNIKKFMLFALQATHIWKWFHSKSGTFLIFQRRQNVVRRWNARTKKKTKTKNEQKRKMANRFDGSMIMSTPKKREKKIGKNDNNNNSSSNAPCCYLLSVKHPEKLRSGTILRRVQILSTYYIIGCLAHKVYTSTQYTVYDLLLLLSAYWVLCFMLGRHTSPKQNHKMCEYPYPSVFVHMCVYVCILYAIWAPLSCFISKIQWILKAFFPQSSIATGPNRTKRYNGARNKITRRKEKIIGELLNEIFLHCIAVFSLFHFVSLVYAIFLLEEKLPTVIKDPNKRKMENVYRKYHVNCQQLSFVLVFFFSVFIHN